MYSARWAASVVLAALAGLLLAPVAWAEWYPDRPVYDYDRAGAAGADCADRDNPAANRGRCGAFDGPVFNSFINTPSHGDERAFFDARLASDTSEGAYANVLPLPGDRPETIVLRVYVNNGANESTGGRSKAIGAKLRIALPTASGRALRVRASVSAENSSPVQVEDTADLVRDDEFKLQYLRGSAVLYRRDGRATLADRVVSRGAPLSNNGTPGEFEAGFDEAVVVELTVRAVPVSHLRTWLILFAFSTLVVTLLAVKGSRHTIFAATGAAWRWAGERSFLIQILASLIASVIFTLLLGLVNGLLD